MPPRTRISEAPKRISSTRDPHQQRRSSSDSDPLHHRPITDRSPRLFSNRQSPKGSQSDPLNQRKLGTRITDLESQLVQAQRELKNLKQQLTCDELPKNTKNTNPQRKQHTQCPQEEVPEETHKETDVFEVPMEKASIERTADLEMEKPDPKNTEMEQLKSKLEAACQENEILKKQVNEVTSEMTATKVKNTELEKELEASNETKTELMEKVRRVEFAKEELEVEMKKLRVQTEQWRKAADAAAAVLAGGDVELPGGGRVSERRGSMEKHFNSVFEPPSMIGAYPGYLGSPGAEDDADDGFGSGKRKGSGIRMFGDLWKKKGQK